MALILLIPFAVYLQQCPKIVDFATTRTVWNDFQLRWQKDWKALLRVIQCRSNLLAFKSSSIHPQRGLTLWNIFLFPPPPPPSFLLLRLSSDNILCSSISCWGVALVRFFSVHRVFELAKITSTRRLFTTSLSLRLEYCSSSSLSSGKRN